MDHIFEIILIFLLIAIQSVFGVGLLLFGTPSFLLFGYDFAKGKLVYKLGKQKFQNFI